MVRRQRLQRLPITKKNVQHINQIGVKHRGVTMKVQFTADAIAMGWATEGEEVTVKELREAVQDDILNA